MRLVDTCHEHNLVEPADDQEAVYGIRVSLPAGDPFRHIIGEEWETYHWFTTRAARDAAMGDMARRHRYSRIGDKPSILLQPVEREQ